MLDQEKIVIARPRNFEKLSAADITILYDVSRLAITKLRHSGISRYTRELYAGLCKSKKTVLPVLMHPGDLSKGEFANDISGFSRYIGRKVYTLEELLVRKPAHPFIVYSPYGPLPGVQTLEPDVKCVTIHDVLHISRSEFYLAKESGRHIRVTLENIGRDDHVIADSEYTKMELQRYTDIGAHQITSIPLGVDKSYRRRSKRDVLEFCQSKNLEVGQYFVLFAQLDPRKNILTAIEAIRRFQVAQPDSQIKFVLVGSAVGVSKLKEIFRKGRLSEESIVLLDSPTDDEMAIAYSGACALIYPSLSEGFGLPPLEAMCCGCPSLVAARTSIPEVVMDSGLYIDPADADNICESLITISSDRGIAKELSKRALYNAKHFSWQKTAHHVDQLFMSLVKSINNELTDCHVYLSKKGLRNLIYSQPNWKLIAGSLEAGEYEYVNNGETVYTQRFIGDSTVGVHGLYIDVAQSGTKFSGSFLAKFLSTSHVAMWVTQYERTDETAKCEVYLDVTEDTVEKIRSEGDVLDPQVGITDLGGGWKLIEVVLSYTEVQHQTIRLTLAGRSESLATSKFNGENKAVFELLGVGLWKIE